MASKYQRFGLRADRSLSDLPNPTKSLNNILEDLVVSQDDKFGAADLLVINGLKDTRVTASRLAQINDTLPSYTPTDGGANRVVLPYVTIKDQIENFKVIAGDPPYLSGGKGPIAYKYASSALDVGVYTTMNSANRIRANDSKNPDVLIGINSNETNTLGPLDFWQGGVFKQSSKFDPKFTDPYGAVVWEGWTGISGMTVTTNGCFLVEARYEESDPWTVLSGANYYDTYFTSAEIDSVTTGESDTVIVFNDTVKFIHEGHRVQFMSSATSNPTEDPGVVTEVAGNTVTIDKVLTNTTAGYLRVYFDPTAENMVSPRFGIPQRYTGLYTNIRITWWYPPVPSTLPYALSTLDNKVFEARFGPQDTIEYYYFYETNPAATGNRKYSYEQFLTDRISQNVRVSKYNITNTESMLFSYSPPTVTGDVLPVPDSNDLRTTNTYLTRSDLTRRTITVDDTAPNFNTYGLNQGDYMVFLSATNQPISAQLFRYGTGKTFYLNPEVDYGTNFVSNKPVTFMKREGLIGIYEANIDHAQGRIQFRTSQFGGMGGVNKGDEFSPYHICAGAILCCVNEANLVDKQPMLLIKRIISYSKIGQDLHEVICEFDTLNPAETPNTAFSQVVVGVYASKGLHDNSAPQQCLGVIGAEVATGQSGNSLTLTRPADELGLATGDYIQFGSDPSSSTYVSDYVPDGTTITVTPGSATVTLSQTGSLAIPGSSTVVFIKSGNWAAGVAKEFCVVPLNTAPPFESVDTGLVTPAGYGLLAGDIEFRNIRLNTTAPINTSTSVNADRFLPLYFGGTRYKLLIKSSG